MCSDFYDVCIIGASIAGNYLCSLIYKLNLKIALIEEHNVIGLPLQCAGIVSKKIAQLIELPENLVLNRVKVARLVSPSGRSIKLSGNEEPYIIDRIGLDKYFFEILRTAPNVTLLQGERFKSFKYFKEGGKRFLSIITSKRNIRTKMIVACDGPISTVAKNLHLKRDVLYAAQIRIKDNFNENEASLYFDPHWKELFGWIVPEGNKLYRIGLASKNNISKKFKQFLKRINIQPSKKLSQQGGIIPYDLKNKIAFNNILLLGDSACQVKSTTGGGIIMLLTAAKYAAVCIKKCFEFGNFSKKFIKNTYEKQCKVTIGNQLKIHFLIRKILEEFTEKDYDTFFKILEKNEIEKQISIYGDMDFPKEIAFKLLKNSTILKFFIKFFLLKPKLIIKLILIILI
ncbi:MAG: hypothetical protein ACFE9R_11445, partial [Candidatus Hermodarchaeota archaeon]